MYIYIYMQNQHKTTINGHGFNSYVELPGGIADFQTWPCLITGTYCRSMGEIIGTGFSTDDATGAHAAY